MKFFTLNASKFFVEISGLRSRVNKFGDDPGLYNLLIKPRTQGNSLRAWWFVGDTTGSDNPGLISPAAKDGLNVNYINQDRLLDLLDEIVRDL